MRSRPGVPRSVVIRIDLEARPVVMPKQIADQQAHGVGFHICRDVAHPYDVPDGRHLKLRVNEVALPDACKRFGSLLESRQVQASSEQFERPNMVCERDASGCLNVVGESV